MSSPTIEPVSPAPVPRPHSHSTLNRLFNNTLWSLQGALDEIPILVSTSASATVPEWDAIRFTAADYALLDAMQTCAKVLASRYSTVDIDRKAILGVAPEIAEGDGVRDGKGKGKSKEWIQKQTAQLERLSDDVLELALSVNLLGSTLELEMGKRSVVDVDYGVCTREQPATSTRDEEGWVDVLKEDGLQKDSTSNDTATEWKECLSREEVDLLPLLSLERKDEILRNISETTSRILATVQSFHLSSCKTVQITDFLGNTFDLPSIDLASQLKTKYETGPGSVHMQEGHFELLDLEDRKTVMSTGKDASWEDGKKLLLALVLSELPPEGKWYCPMLGCGGCSLKKAREGGQICSVCGVWFAKTAPPRQKDVDDDKKVLSAGESVSAVASASASEQQSGESPTKLWSIPRKPQKDSLQGLRYVKTTDPIIFPNPASDEESFFACKNCYTHLALQKDINSRNFRGQHGKAWLFSSVVNVTRGASAERNLTTGKHQVCDVFCRQCGGYVGWGYEAASELSERYKVGKFVLELEILTCVDVVRSEDAAKSEDNIGERVV